MASDGLAEDRLDHVLMSTLVGFSATALAAAVPVLPFRDITPDALDNGLSGRATSPSSGDKEGIEVIMFHDRIRVVHLWLKFHLRPFHLRNSLSEKRQR